MRFASSLSLVFLALFAASASAAPLSLSATEGGVKATISGEAQERDTESQVLRRMSALTVEVTGGGTTFSGPLPACKPDCGDGEAFMSATVAVRDLDGDGSPEVLVDRFRDGDVCCSTSTTVLDVLAGAWRSLKPLRFGSYVRLEDADGDGDDDLVGDDPRFFTRFAVRALGTFLPLRVHRYEGDGRFVDITMALRPALRVQRTDFVSALKGAPKGVTRAALPGIAAIDHLLGEHRKAERRIKSAVRRKRISASLATRMRRFLKRSGYCAGCAAPAAIDARLP